MTIPSIKIDDITPRVSYSVGGTPQATFDVPFAFFTDEDVTVFKGGSTTPLILDADYTVVGAGTDTPGARSITLTTSVTNTTIEIILDVPIKRVTDFPISGPLQIPALNNELDRIVAIQQQLNDEIVRSLRLSIAESTINTELPPVATRKDKFLGFGPAGEILALQPPTFTAGVSEFNNRAAAAAATIGAGINFLRVAGFTAAGDGGEAIYKKVASEPPTVGGKLQTADLTWWELADTIINVLQFGADPTRTVDSKANVQQCIDFLAAKGGGKMVWPRGLYDISAELLLTSNIDIFFQDPVINFNNATPFAKLFTATGVIASSHLLFADVKFGQQIIKLTAGAAANYARGDYILLTSEKDWGPALHGKEGEILQVGHVSTSKNTLFVTTGLRGPEYLTANSAKVFKITPVTNIRMTGRARIFGQNSYPSYVAGTSIMGASVNSGSPTLAHHAIMITNGVDILVEGLIFSDFAAENVTLINVLRGTVKGCTVLHAVADASDGYGLSAGNACQEVAFIDNVIHQTRHAVAGGGGYTLASGMRGVCRGLVYRGNRIWGSTGEGNAVDVHPTADDVLIEGNTVIGSTLHGILSRCRRPTAKDNLVIGARDAGIYATNDSNYPGVVHIVANTVIGTKTRGLQLTASDSGGSANGKMFLPGEMVFQGNEGTYGVVRSVIKFSGAYNIYIDQASDSAAFAVSTTAITGSASGAISGQVTAITTWPDNYGIRVLNGAQGFWLTNIVGNVIDGSESDILFNGIEAQDMSGPVITNNSIITPVNHTGAGIHLNNTFTGLATINTIRRILPVGGTSTHVKVTAGSGNTTSGNALIN